MGLRHPFERWPLRRRGSALLLAAVGAVVVDVPLFLVNRALETDEAPRGIISMELAGSGADVEAIVESWDAAGALAEAGFSSGLDFLFMALYAVATAGACVGLAQRGWLPRVGLLLAWAGLAAGAFDAVETAIQSAFVLGATSGDGPAMVMTGAAVTKFGLLALCLVYVLSGVPTLVRSRGGRRHEG